MIVFCGAWRARSLLLCFARFAFVVAVAVAVRTHVGGACHRVVVLLLLLFVHSQQSLLCGHCDGGGGGGGGDYNGDVGRYKSCSECTANKDAGEMEESPSWQFTGGSIGGG